MNSPRVNKVDVVMVDVPYLDANRSIVRPVLVVCDTSQLLDVIIAAMSSRIRDPLPPAHYVINRAHRDWTASGLRLNSVVRCDRVFTIHDSHIHQKLGSLSPQTIAEIDAVLKKVFRIH
jgi:mRNA-degrading endonuclease toxin of MazEF toxin-antitoxin module